MNLQPLEPIDRYHTHFSAQIEQIQSISCRSAEVFKKSLYCSLLDALSRSVFPTKGPRGRFTSLIRRFGGWKYIDHVSLPHLGRLMELVPDPAFEGLRKSVHQRLSEWEAPWDSIGLARDPHQSEVLKLWPRGDAYKKPIKNVGLESLTHLHLLYSHRNILVHELRPPGYGMDIGTEVEPFYHDLSSFGDGDNQGIDTFELVYPVAFFEALAKRVICNLRTYFVENNVNPFDSYRFGSYWIEGLN